VSASITQPRPFAPIKSEKEIEDSRKAGIPTKNKTGHKVVCEFMGLLDIIQDSGEWRLSQHSQIYLIILIAA